MQNEKETLKPNDDSQKQPEKTSEVEKSRNKSIED